MANRTLGRSGFLALATLGTALLLAVAVAVFYAAPAPASAGGDAEGDAEGGESSATGGTPKNVIVMISDGMGFNQVDLASMYQYGTSMYQPDAPKTPSQVYQNFPVQTAMATYSAGDEPEDGEEPEETGYDPQRAASDIS